MKRAAFCVPVFVLLLAAAVVLPLGGILAGAGSAGPGVVPVEWPARIVLGTVPTEGSENTLERFKPLAAQLERVLGIKVETRTASDYAGVITAMAQQHVDVAYLGPKSYVEAATRAGAQAVAAELDRDGVPGYHSIIIARKGAGAVTLDDVKGKTFAFTDPNSTSGYLVPMMHFKRDLKVDPKAFFKEIRFAGSHQASMLAVANGSVDAAAANDLDFARIVKSGQARGDDFVVLWTSELIPGAPVVVRKELPESLKAAIIGALMMMNDDAAALDRLGNGGFQYASDATYDVMRYLMRMQEEGKGGK